MNKLTKVGCSALCGSLAAVSAANAGTLSVTGGADLTFTSLSKQVTGQPVGMGSNINLKGSGELDNGWTYDLTIANANALAFSAANITLDMQALGKINFNQGNSGNGIQAYDDKMPTAWEEAWGAGLSGGVKLVTGSGTSQNVMYTTPTFAGTTVALTYAHEYGASDVGDKSTGVAGAGAGRSYDATININPAMGTEILSGLNIFAGASTIESRDNNTAVDNDQYQGVMGTTLDLGPISVGAQWSAVYTGVDDKVGTIVAAYHTYKNHAFGIAFNINDDLSVSYGEHTSRKAGYNNTAAQSGAPGTREVTVESWQAAYTMGGASIRIADVQVDNNAFSAGASRDATVLSLGLAF
jgi:hypothetical protein